MKKMIGNGPVITRDCRHPFYENGAVVFEGETIVEAGPLSEMRKKYKEASFLDAGGKVIMPGLINAHQHIYSAFARGLSLPGPAPKDFLETLDGIWWKIDRHLTLENTYYSALATYMECIRNGVTTVIDHHAGYGAVKGSLLEIARAAEETGVRTCLAYEVSDRDGRKKRNESIQENMEFIDYARRKDSDMVKGLVGLHASFTLSDETLKILVQENSHHAGYHVHIAEGLYDEEYTVKNYGTSVVARFNDWGILSERSLAGHCIHIGQKDRELIKESGVTVVHNPESNMNNGVGCPDVLAMIDMGIPVGLGTDGYTNDMLESLKVANILQKHRRQRPDRGFAEACSLLFDTNAAAASKVFGVTTGVLKEGAKADIIVMDYKPYTPLTSENINGHVMFGMSGAMTDTTVINGTVAMLHKKILTVEEDASLTEAKNSAVRLWRELEDKGGACR